MKKTIKRNAQRMLTSSPRYFMAKDLLPHLPKGQLVIARNLDGTLYVLWPRQTEAVRLQEGVDVEPALTIKEAKVAFGPKHGVHEPPAHATILYWIKRGLLKATKDSLSRGRGGAWFIPQSAIDTFHAPKRGAPFRSLRK